MPALVLPTSVALLERLHGSSCAPVIVVARKDIFCDSNVNGGYTIQENVLAADGPEPSITAVWANIAAAQQLGAGDQAGVDRLSSYCPGFRNFILRQLEEPRAGDGIHVTQIACRLLLSSAARPVQPGLPATAFEVTSTACVVEPDSAPDEAPRDGPAPPRCCYLPWSSSRGRQQQAVQGGGGGDFWRPQRPVAAVLLQFHALQTGAQAASPDARPSSGAVQQVDVPTTPALPLHDLGASQAPFVAAAAAGAVTAIGDSSTAGDAGAGAAAPAAAVVTANTSDRLALVTQGPPRSQLQQSAAVDQQQIHLHVQRPQQQQQHRRERQQIRQQQQQHHLAVGAGGLQVPISSGADRDAEGILSALYMAADAAAAAAAPSDVRGGPRNRGPSGDERGGAAGGAGAAGAASTVSTPGGVSGWWSRSCLVLSALPVCITVFSREGRIIFQNAASLHYFGARLVSDTWDPGAATAAAVAAAAPPDHSANRSLATSASTSRAGPVRAVTSKGLLSRLLNLGGSSKRKTTAGGAGCGGEERSVNEEEEWKQAVKRSVSAVTPATGLLLGRGAAEGEGPGDSALPALFTFERSKLEELWAATAVEGGMWQGMLRVPRTLNPDGASSSSSSSSSSRFCSGTMGASGLAQGGSLQPTSADPTSLPPQPQPPVTGGAGGWRVEASTTPAPSAGSRPLSSSSFASRVTKAISAIAPMAVVVEQGTAGCHATICNGTHTAQHSRLGSDGNDGADAGPMVGSAVGAISGAYPSPSGEHHSVGAMIAPMQADCPASSARPRNYARGLSTGLFHSFSAGVRRLGRGRSGTSTGLSATAASVSVQRSHASFCSATGTSTNQVPLAAAAGMTSAGADGRGPACREAAVMETATTGVDVVRPRGTSLDWATGEPGAAAVVAPAMAARARSGSQSRWRSPSAMQRRWASVHTLRTSTWQVVFGSATANACNSLGIAPPSCSQPSVTAVSGVPPTGHGDPPTTGAATAGSQGAESVPAQDTDLAPGPQPGGGNRIGCAAAAAGVGKAMTTSGCGLALGSASTCEGGVLCSTAAGGQWHQSHGPERPAAPSVTTGLGGPMALSDPMTDQLLRLPSNLQARIMAGGGSAPGRQGCNGGSGNGSTNQAAWGSGTPPLLPPAVLAAVRAPLLFAYQSCSSDASRLSHRQSFESNLAQVYASNTSTPDHNRAADASVALLAISPCGLGGGGLNSSATTAAAAPQSRVVAFAASLRTAPTLPKRSSSTMAAVVVPGGGHISSSRSGHRSLRPHTGGATTAMPSSSVSQASFSQPGPQRSVASVSAVASGSKCGFWAARHTITYTGGQCNGRLEDDDEFAGLPRANRRGSGGDAYLIDTAAAAARRKLSRLRAASERASSLHKGAHSFLRLAADRSPSFAAADSGTVVTDPMAAKGPGPDSTGAAAVVTAVDMEEEVESQATRPAMIMESDNTKAMKVVARVAAELNASVGAMEAADGAAMTVDAADKNTDPPSDPPPECWHEVVAVGVVDPASGQHGVVVMQRDVTAKVVAERHVAQVSETEHRLLEQIFPRHVLQYIMEEAGLWAATEGDVAADPLEELDTLDQDTACGLPPTEEAAINTANARWRPQIRDCNRLAVWHPQVTVLFADIQGFTPMCKVLPPDVVMSFLNTLFTRFDSMLDYYRVYKVETIGDCYMVAGGLIREDEDGMAAVQGGGQVDPDQAANVVGFAKAMLVAASSVALPTSGQPVRVRVGIHSGPVVSGVVGTRMPRFCLFGDTVNTASRMESTGVPGAIHVSEECFQLLRRRDPAAAEGWVATGGVEVKGKGLMRTRVWTPPPPTSLSTVTASSTLISKASDSAALLSVVPSPHVSVSHREELPQRRRDPPPPPQLQQQQQHKERGLPQPLSLSTEMEPVAAANATAGSSAAAPRRLHDPTGRAGARAGARPGGGATLPSAGAAAAYPSGTKQRSGAVAGGGSTPATANLRGGVSVPSPLGPAAAPAAATAAAVGSGFLRPSMLQQAPQPVLGHSWTLLSGQTKGQGQGWSEGREATGREGREASSNAAGSVGGGSGCGGLAGNNLSSAPLAAVIAALAQQGDGRGGKPFTPAPAATITASTADARVGGHGIGFGSGSGGASTDKGGAGSGGAVAASGALEALHATTSTDLRWSSRHAADLMTTVGTAYDSKAPDISSRSGGNGGRYDAAGGGGGGEASSAETEAGPGPRQRPVDIVGGGAGGSRLRVGERRLAALRRLDSPAAISNASSGVGGIGSESHSGNNAGSVPGLGAYEAANASTCSSVALAEMLGMGEFLAPLVRPGVFAGAGGSGRGGVGGRGHGGDGRRLQGTGGFTASEQTGQRQDGAGGSRGSGQLQVRGGCAARGGDAPVVG